MNNRYENYSVPSISSASKSAKLRNFFHLLRRKFDPEIYKLRPWYHDFSDLGVITNFPPEKKWIFFGSEVDNTMRHMIQQPRKSSIIQPYIEEALQLVKNGNACSRVLDIFCSDGYYGLWAASKTNCSLTGVDMNRYDILKANTIGRHLKIKHFDFVCEDVGNYISRTNEKFDLILNLGGLYHLEDPKELLKKLYSKLKGYMIVQSAISVGSNDPDFFTSPRPGFSYGSWFSQSTLRNWLLELNYKILKESVNERPAPNKEKVGGAYFLVTV